VARRLLPTALRARLSVPGGAGSFEAKVSAVAVNFNGETKRTPQVTITEPL
jgi:cell division FtsZ-interacting protein ZapD